MKKAAGAWLAAGWLGYVLLCVFVAIVVGVWLLHRRHRRRHARRSRGAKPVGAKPMLPLD